MTVHQAILLLVCSLLLTCLCQIQHYFYLLMLQFLLASTPGFVVSAVFGVICSGSLLLKHAHGNKEFIGILDE